MTDDFAELVTEANCYAISNTSSIYAYKNGTRATYNQIGGKWYKTAENSYTSIPSSSVCYSYADITAISSKAEFFPIYELIALALALFVWFFVFRLISRLVRWRI